MPTTTAQRTHRGNDGKPLLLAVGYQIESTGLTRVMNSILEPLAGLYEIHHLGIGYRGEPRTDGVQLHPSNLEGGDVFGAYQCRSMLERLRPDLVFILLDLWMLSTYLGFLEGYLGDAKVVTYSPLDGTLLNDEPLAALPGVERLVVYTEFARDEVRRVAATRKPGPWSTPMPPVEVLPHGIDTTAFRPLPESERRALRRRLLGDEASFVVLNANRPRERKRMDLTIEGFARFAAGKPSSVQLYLHHARTEPEERREILDLAARHGILGRLLLNPMGDEPDHASDSELNLLYNACEVGLNTSIGEGWGLVSFEHAATGAAQVVPRHSACAELWEGAAELVEPVEEVPLWGPGLGMKAVSAEGVAEALGRLYDDPGHRQRLATAGFERATRPEYGWDDIARRWDRLFGEVLAASASAPRRAVAG